MLLILTGRIHSGKTTRLRQLVSEWRSQGISLDGYLSPAVFESGSRVGYDWLDLETGGCDPFLRRRGEQNWERVGPYFFVPQTLEKAKKKITAHNPRQFLIVDEVGPREMQGGGVWPALKTALSESSLGCLLVVREDILELFQQVAPVRPERIFHIEESGLPSVLAGTIKNCQEAPEDNELVRRPESGTK